MPISETPPPRIGKIGPYTVFVTPPASPNSSLKPDNPKKPVAVPVQKVVQPPPPVMAPPVQYCEDKSVFAFFWDAVAKVQNAHASLDEHVAHWFGLNQSKYQWALDNYCEKNGKLFDHPHELIIYVIHVDYRTKQRQKCIAEYKMYNMSRVSFNQGHLRKLFLGTRPSRV